MGVLFHRLDGVCVKEGGDSGEPVEEKNSFQVENYVIFPVGANFFAFLLHSSGLPNRPTHECIRSQTRRRIKDQIAGRHLVQIGRHFDLHRRCPSSELPHPFDTSQEYVLVLVQNKKTLAQVTSDLGAFLNKDAPSFSEW